MLPKLWEFPETICPFFFTYGETIETRSNALPISSRLWVPYLCKHPAGCCCVCQESEAYLRSTWSLYVQACNGNASTFLCVRMEYLLGIHSYSYIQGVRTTGLSIYLPPMHGICHIHTWYYLVSVCTCQTGRPSTSSAGLDTACVLRIPTYDMEAYIASARYQADTLAHGPPLLSL